MIGFFCANTNYRCPVWPYRGPHTAHRHSARCNATCYERGRKRKKGSSADQPIGTGRLSPATLVAMPWPKRLRSEPRHHVCIAHARIRAHLARPPSPPGDGRERLRAQSMRRLRGARDGDTAVGPHDGQGLSRPPGARDSPEVSKKGGAKCTRGKVESWALGLLGSRM